MADPRERFSDRVADYVRYRPGYPDAMESVFRGEMNFSAASRIADVGSGTGISAKFFLDRGASVAGVEPNAAMRAAAEEILRNFPRFRSVDGTAEATNLDDASVDIALAAQAFHWFDTERAAAEFRRIVRPGGFAVLIWNERLLDATEFLRGYEDLLLSFGTDYDKVRHDRIDDARLAAFLGGAFRTAVFDNSQSFDFEGVKGRLKSSSYTPSEDDPAHGPMIAELKLLFEKCAENGRIEVFYKTNIFFRRL